MREFKDCGRERMPLGWVSFTNAVPVSVFLPKAKKREERTAHVFEPLQLQVLEQQTGQKAFTLKAALVAIAALAGFAPSNKQPLPGEKTIWRGWNSFSSMCRGYKLAPEKYRV